jgi:acetyl esterase
MINRTIKLFFLVATNVLTCWTNSQVAKGQPTSLISVETKVYKTIGHMNLKLYVFHPSERKNEERLSAIVFFFGGGWKRGKVTHFLPQAKYMAERGMVAILADFRVMPRHGVTPFECVADAKSVIRWLRMHADELGIDNNRIVASGGSSGGHMAACTALIKDFDAKNEDLNVSSVPNALVLFNPALDLSHIVEYANKNQVRDWHLRALEISPVHHVFQGAPPTIIFHGTADQNIPIQLVINFCEVMKKYGNHCEVIPFEGRDHGFFNYGIGDNSDFYSTMDYTVKFLISIGFLNDLTIKK